MLRACVLVVHIFIAMALVSGQNITGAGYGSPVPVPVAPCQLVTFYSPLASPSGTADISAPSFPLPSNFGGISAQVTTEKGAFSAAILREFLVDYGSVDTGTIVLVSRSGAATIQIPCDVPLGLQRYSLVLSNSNTAGGTQLGYLDLVMAADSIHVLRVGDTLTAAAFRIQANPVLGLATHVDGSAVTAASPAKQGETIAIWAVGLGLPSSGTVQTGAANPVPPLSTSVNIDFDFRANAGPTPPSTANYGGPHVPATKIPAYFAPGLAGLYQINVTIPPSPVPLAACSGSSSLSNLTINIGGTSSFDGAQICVAP